MSEQYAKYVIDSMFNGLLPFDVLDYEEALEVLNRDTYV